MQLNLGKKFGIDKTQVIPLTTEASLVPETKEFLTNPPILLPCINVPLNISPLYSGIILGSGSAIPSKYRNVSSIFLDFTGYGTVLLDAGEGSYGQLFRALGPEALQKAILNLKVIFISHLHADHHLGLVRFLHERNLLVNFILLHCIFAHFFFLHR